MAAAEDRPQCATCDGSGEQPLDESHRYACDDCCGSGVDCSMWTQERLDRNVLAILVANHVPQGAMPGSIGIRLERFMREAREALPETFLAKTRWKGGRVLEQRAAVRKFLEGELAKLQDGYGHREYLVPAQDPLHRLEYLTMKQLEELHVRIDEAMDKRPPDPRKEPG